jgi:hypothetical protein
MRFLLLLLLFERFIYYFNLLLLKLAMFIDYEFLYV